MAMCPGASCGGGGLLLAVGVALGVGCALGVEVVELLFELAGYGLTVRVGVGLWVAVVSREGVAVGMPSACVLLVFTVEER